MMIVGIVLTVAILMAAFIIIMEQKDAKLHNEIEKKSKEYTEQLKERLKKEKEKNEQSERTSD